MLLWKFRKFFNFFNVRKQKNASALVNSFKILKIPQNKKILFISPHPDDETIAAGGLLYEAANENCDIYIILISGGEKWGPKDIRLKEFNLSCKSLGVKINNTAFLNFPDKFSRNTANRIKVYRAIRKAFKEIAPDYFIYPSALDLDKDHKLIGQLAGQLKKRKTAFLSYLIHYIAFPKPYRFRPNEFIVPPVKLLNENNWINFPLNANALEKKHAAMLNHRTQLSVPGMRNVLLSFIRQNEIFIQN